MSTWSRGGVESLVPLSVGHHDRAIYCVHAIGGTVAFFAPLARRLAAVRDVYGLQCHGITPGCEPDRTIEAMAQRYVDAIVAERPHGPYELLGYSMGGLIAFEMSRHLIARGQRVALTGILDTTPPGTPAPRLGTAAALSLISRAIGLFPPFTADPNQADDVLLKDFLAVAVERGILPGGPAGFRVADLRPMVDIYAVNGEACHTYRPGRLRGGGVRYLFTRSGGMAALMNQWHSYVDSDATVDIIDANHFALMHEDHAADVATVVTGWLTR